MSRDIRIQPITGHQVRTLDADFTDPARLHIAILRIQQADTNAFAKTAYRPDSHAAGTVPARRRDLRHAVHLAKRQPHNGTEGRFATRAAPNRRR